MTKFTVILALFLLGCIKNPCVSESPKEIPIIVHKAANIKWTLYVVYPSQEIKYFEAVNEGGLIPIEDKDWKCAISGKVKTNYNGELEGLKIICSHDNVIADVFVACILNGNTGFESGNLSLDNLELDGGPHRIFLSCRSE